MEKGAIDAKEKKLSDMQYFNSTIYRKGLGRVNQKRSLSNKDRSVESRAMLRQFTLFSWN